MSMIQFTGHEVEFQGTICAYAIPARLVTGLCRVIERSGDFPFEPGTVLLTAGEDAVNVVRSPSLERLVEALEALAE